MKNKEELINVDTEEEKKKSKSKVDWESCLDKYLGKRKLSTVNIKAQYLEKAEIKNDQDDSMIIFQDIINIENTTSNHYVIEKQIRNEQPNLAGNPSTLSLPSFSNEIVTLNCANQISVSTQTDTSLFHSLLHIYKTPVTPLDIGILAHMTAMMSFTIVSNIMDDMGIVQSVSDVIDDAMCDEKMTVYDMGKLVIKECIQCVNSSDHTNVVEKDKKQSSLMEKSYRMLVNLCITFYIELKVITRSEAESIKQDQEATLEMTQSFLLELIKAVIQTESKTVDTQLGILHNTEDHKLPLLLRWLPLLNIPILSVDIDDPALKVHFNCIYHGDKLKTIYIDASAFTPAYTHLGNLLSKHLHFAFMFMRMSRYDTILDTGNGTCYSNWLPDMLDNVKRGRPAYCDVCVCEYVCDSVGYVCPTDVCEDGGLQIFCDKVNNIRVVSKKDVLFQDVLAKLIPLYTRTNNAKENVSLLSKIKLSPPYQDRTIILDQILQLLPNTLRKRTPESIIEQRYIIDKSAELLQYKVSTIIDKLKTKVEIHISSKQFTAPHPPTIVIARIHTRSTQLSAIGTTFNQTLTTFAACSLVCLIDTLA